MKKTTKTADRITVAYLRTSKEIQEKQRQREIIDRWSKERTIEVAEVVEDSGSRDLSFKRTGWLYLMQLVRAGKVSRVLIAERDRLGFADAYEYGHVITEFRTHGVELWCCSTGKQLTSSTDRMEPILATLDADKSKEEQSGIALRVQTSKRSRVERGEWTGGKVPYGFDLVCREDSTNREMWRLVYEPGKYKRVCHYPDGTAKRFDGQHNTPKHNHGETVRAEVSKDAVTVGWVRKIFQWFRDGMSYRGIATQLNSAKVPALYTKSWLGATIKGILRNAIYVSGMPVYNKQAQGRFQEWVGGKLLPVERVNGRAKAGRKRTTADHIMGAPKPANAIIDNELWNAVQERIRGMDAAPKKERRPRSADLFLAGLVVCSDCDQPMAGWKQHDAYKCSTNSKYKGHCRCNKTRHATLEAVVMKYLDDTGHSLELFRDDPEGAWELVELGLTGEPLIMEYHRAFARMLKDAKTAGHKPPPEGWTYKSLRAIYAPVAAAKAEDLSETIRQKEEERGRLVKRMGLLEDEDAAEAVAARIREVTTELKELREKARPVTDKLDALREQVGAILEQTKQVRAMLSECLPRQKGEAVRRVVSQIRVRHEERMMGKLRASRLVSVEIIPAVGAPATFHPVDSREPAFAAKSLRVCYGLDVLQPLEARHPDTRITSSRLLPRMLELKGQGKNNREVGEALGVTKRVVEHVLARHRRAQTAEESRHSPTTQIVPSCPHDYSEQV